MGVPLHHPQPVISHRTLACLTALGHSSVLAAPAAMHLPQGPLHLFCFVASTLLPWISMWLPSSFSPAAAGMSPCKIPATITLSETALPHHSPFPCFLQLLSTSHHLSILQID